VPLDLAIDRAVREIVAGEAPDDLGARVLAALEQPAPGAWWSPGRLAWAGAALALIAIATYLSWGSRPAPLVEPNAVVAQARPPAVAPVETPTPAEAVPPTPAAPARAVATPAPARAVAATVAAAAIVEPAPHAFSTPRLVEPLEEPPAVAIQPLAEPQLAIEPVAVGRLSFEPVVIEPLRPDR